jgi:hypothetical protein
MVTLARLESAERQSKEAIMIILYLWVLLVIGVLAYEIKHHSIG